MSNSEKALNCMAKKIHDLQRIRFRLMSKETVLSSTYMHWTVFTLNNQTHKQKKKHAVWKFGTFFEANLFW